jgi:hypothetical protein
MYHDPELRRSSLARCPSVHLHASLEFLDPSPLLMSLGEMGGKAQDQNTGTNNQLAVDTMLK